MSQSVLLSYFDSEEHVLEATRAARGAGYAVHDVYTPYAIHGMDEALGLKPSRLTWVCFGAGLLGATSALALQYYTSVVSWPLNVGGKPFNSFPAFIYCAHCHGAGGLGDGLVAARFPRPPSLLAEHARGLADGQLFHIITHGQGLMPAHGSQVAPEDRWKLVHYLRSLQAPTRTAQKDTP